MPLPILGWVAVAAGAAVIGALGSEECECCGKRFVSSDCKYYCEDCCEQRRLARIERERLEREEQEREKIRQAELQRHQREEQERERKREQEAQSRREREIERERQREIQKEKNRLKAIEDKRLADIRAEEKRKKEEIDRINRKANEKREILLDKIIINFEKNILNPEKKILKLNLKNTIEKDKMNQLKIINEKQQFLLNNKLFNEYIDMYVSEL
jgi:hypothetical protein